MKNPHSPSLSSKIVAVSVIALALSAPTIFAQRGPGGPGGGGGGGGRGQNQPKTHVPDPSIAVTDKYDKNRNGRIDKDELKVIHDSDKALFDELMKFDANKDLVLDSSELVKWADSKKQSKPQGGGGGGGPGGPGGA
jgi:hypothetical protein